MLEKEVCQVVSDTLERVDEFYNTSSLLPFCIPSFLGTQRRPISMTLSRKNAVPKRYIVEKGGCSY